MNSKFDWTFDGRGFLLVLLSHCTNKSVNAGGPLATMMANAKASRTAGFIAVFRASDGRFETATFAASNKAL